MPDARRTLVLLAVLVCFAAACSSSPKPAALSGGPSALASSAPVVASSNSTTGAGVCPAYLDYIGNGFASHAVADLAANLPSDAPPNVVSAVHVLPSYRGGRVPDDVDSALQEWVLNVCRGTYLKDVQPQATTADAARKLFAAVETASRTAAVPVASAAAIARFEPWGQLATPSDEHQFIAVDEDTFRFKFDSNGDFFECSGSGGVIQICDLVQP